MDPKTPSPVKSPRRALLRGSVPSRSVLPRGAFRALFSIAVLGSLGIGQESPRREGKIFQSTQPILDQIQAAVDRGEKRVRLSPGIYYSHTAPKKIHLTLKRLSDLEIDATGVTLIASNLVAALEIIHCRNLTLRGLTIDYDPLPMTQGAIVDFGTNREWTEIRIHPGYPEPTALEKGWGFLWTSDPVTRDLKPGTANRNNLRLENRGSGVWRVHHSRGIQDLAAKGDLLRIPQAVESASAVYAHFSTNLVLDGLTLLSSPYHFACAFQWLHGLTLRHCRVVPGPPPSGAKEPRIFSSVGDGFNTSAVTGHLIIEDCETDSTGDDGIPVYTEPMLVLAGAGARLTVAFRSPDAPLLQPGARLRLYARQSGRIEDVTVQRATRSTMAVEAIQQLRQASMNRGNPAFQVAMDVELDSAATARPGDEAQWLDECLAPTVIRRNRIHNSGSRGIVANRSQLRLEENQIDTTYLPGIHIFAFFRSQGGSGFQEDLLVKNNQVENACVGWPRNPGWLGAISIVNWDAGEIPLGGHRRVSVLSNEVKRPWGVGIQIHGVSDLELQGNRVVEPGLRAATNSIGRSVPNQCAIFLEQVDRGKVRANRVDDPGAHFARPALVESSCRDLESSRAFEP